MRRDRDTGRERRAHLLAGDRFAVRALTRRPHADEALTLGALGAEVVTGDLGEVRSVRRAMTGVHGVFGVTDWWEHFEESEAQGRNIVEAAAQAGVAHLVPSGLPSCGEATGGLVNAAPFEAKAAVERHARATCVPATFAAYRAMQDGLDAAVASTRALHPPTRDFATWATANRTEFRWSLDRATPPPARPPS